MLRTTSITACQVLETRENVAARLVEIAHIAELPETQSSDVLLFPEGYLQGYLTDESTARRNSIDLGSSIFQHILHQLSAIKPILVFGMIESENDLLFNTAIVIHDGTLIGKYQKTHLLPGESAFQPGSSSPIFNVNGLKFGINICYDMQFPAAAAAVAAQGADIILCPANNLMRRVNAEIWKDRHHEMRIQRAQETGLWIISADVTGTHAGDRVGYGPTSVISPAGQIVSQVPLLKTGVTTIRVPNR